MYLVTNSSFCEANGELAAMPYIVAYQTYIAARKSIATYTIWKVAPVLVRRVTPLRVVNKLNGNINSCHIATFKGVERNGIEIWFSISIITAKFN